MRKVIVAYVSCFLFLAAGCGGEAELLDDEMELGDEHAVENDDPGDEETDSVAQAASCAARMSIFPVRAAHNIGYDSRSCGTGTCKVSCPDVNANSDWNENDHQGIDIFAHYRAELVAVAPSTVIAVGVIPASGIRRVKLRDDCGWEYYYSHLDQSVVSYGQRVNVGQVIGYMGKSGTPSVHLHFNVSGAGSYNNDINPITLLKATSASACGGAVTAPAPAPVSPPPATPSVGECGLLRMGEQLLPGQAKKSCDGRFSFVHQTDGNVVFYKGSTILWWSGTMGRKTTQLILQHDGNLVLYNGTTPVWNTQTWGNPYAVLQIAAGDSRAVLFGSNWKVLWQVE